MTQPQTPQPLPEPGHAMTMAQYKRFTAMFYGLMAREAEQESKQQIKKPAYKAGFCETSNF